MSFQAAEGLSINWPHPMHLPNTVILVVEDEILIRMDIVDQLAARDYHVLEACNATAALEAIAAVDKIDVLFTDIDMPGDMDGVQLALTVSRSRPGIAIVVCSGKADISVGDLPKRTRVCAKPCDPDALHVVIQDLVGTAG